MKITRIGVLLLTLTAAMFASVAISATSTADNATPECSDGFTFDSTENTCSRSTAPVVGCPDGAQGQPGDCFEIVPGALTPSCEAGELVTSGETTQCRIDQEPATGGGCPEGFSLNDQSGECTASSPATPGPDTCPASAQGTAPDCVSPVDRLPDTLACTEPATIDGTVCVELTEPAFACPVPITVDFGCVNNVLIDNEVCPDGAAQVDFAQGGLICAVPVDLVATCPDGFTLVPGDGSCRLETQPTVIAGMCPPPAVDQGGECVESVDAIPGELGCPDDAPPVGTNCVSTAPVVATSCTDGYVLDGATCNLFGAAEATTTCPADATTVGNECRRVVADSAVGSCADPLAVLIDGRCVVTEARNRAPASPYPGPFTNMPAGPQGSILQAPDVQPITSASAEDPPLALPLTTELAHTGATSEPVFVAALFLLGFGCSFMALGRQQRLETHR